MRLVGSAALLISMAFLGGCSPAQRAVAHSPTDVFGAMDKELAQSFGGKVDGFDAMEAELSHAIGTTVLTSAILPSAMPRAVEFEPALQTWGVSTAPASESPAALASGVDPSDLSDERE